MGIFFFEGNVYSVYYCRIIFVPFVIGFESILGDLEGV